MSSLREERVLREDNTAKVVTGGQSYSEVLGWSKSPEEDCFHAHKELIASVPKWLKEALAEMGRHALASLGEDSEKAPANFLHQSRNVHTLEVSGWSNHRTGEVGVVSGEWRRTQVLEPSAPITIGVTCEFNQVRMKGLEGADGVYAFNATLELGYVREWLSRLRGEVDASLLRIDEVLKNLKLVGLGQGCMEAGRVPNPREILFKGSLYLMREWALGSSPKGKKASLGLKRPMVGKRVDAWEGSCPSRPKHPGCPILPKSTQGTAGSSSLQDTGTHKKLAGPVMKRVEKGGYPDDLGKSVEKGMCFGGLCSGCLWCSLALRWCRW
jgi:hypothetical protein